MIRKVTTTIYYREDGTLAAKEEVAREKKWFVWVNWLDDEWCQIARPYDTEADANLAIAKWCGKEWDYHDETDRLFEARKEP